MEVSQKALLFLMLSGFLTGALLGVLYDALRLIRRAVATAGNGEVPSYAKAWNLPILGSPSEWKRGNAFSHGVTAAVTVVCDLLFGLVCGISVLLLVYDQNDGVFRMSVPVAVFAGFFLFRISVGRLVCVLEDAILFFAGLAFRYLFLLFALPFRLASCAARALYRVTLAPVIRRMHDVREAKQSEKRIALLLNEAKNAFLGEDFLKNS